MGQRAPYIPRADGHLRDWLCNYAQILHESAETLHVSQEAAAEAMLIAQRFADAYAAARSPATQSPGNVKIKNSVRREAWSFFRPMSMRIKRDRSIPDGAKVAIGVIPDHREQSPIPKPTTRPILMLQETNGLSHRLRRFDPERPTSRAMPYGVTMLLVAIAYTRPLVTLPDDPAEWDSHRMMTRHVFTIAHPPQRRGMRVHYAARWETQRGLAGPWSGVVAGVLV